MVGRVLENRFPPVDNKPKDVILSIQHLSTKYEPHLQDITFDVHEGEIFGLYGLVGAGRTELLETIFGIRTRAAGRVYFKNQLMNFTCAKEAMDYGFALITEERKANGLFLKADITFNTTIANMNHYKNVFLHRRQQKTIGFYGFLLSGRFYIYGLIVDSVVGCRARFVERQEGISVFLTVLYDFLNRVGGRCFSVGVVH